MSKNDATIERMILDVGGKKIELTTDQAKKLHAALDELFGAKDCPSPIYIERDPWRWPYRRYEITYGTGVNAKFDRSSGTLSCAV